MALNQPGQYVRILDFFDQWKAKTAALAQRPEQAGHRTVEAERGEKQKPPDSAPCNADGGSS